MVGATNPLPGVSPCREAPKDRNAPADTVANAILVAKRPYSDRLSTPTSERMGSPYPSIVVSSRGAMARSDGPSTMSGPHLMDPTAIRSGRKMNNDARRQRAIELYLIANPSERERVTRLLGEQMTTYEIALQLGVMSSG